MVAMCDQEEIQPNSIGKKYITTLTAQLFLMLKGGTKSAVYSNRNRADYF